jgi:hypothetical protein
MTTKAEPKPLRRGRFYFYRDRREGAERLVILFSHTPADQVIVVCGTTTPNRRASVPADVLATARPTSAARIRRHVEQLPEQLREGARRALAIAEREYCQLARAARALLN